MLDSAPAPAPEPSPARTPAGAPPPTAHPPSPAADGSKVRRYLQLSVVVALLTIALKTAAWWWTDSLSLASDALESLVNLAGALFALAMVTVAQRPADEDHPFGHHKAEYFSSGFEGVLIIAAALGILWAAFGRLFAPQPLDQLGLGVALAVLSSALNGGLALAMLRQARVHRSVALEADAQHLITDVWTSAGVVLGLIGVALTGWLWLDPVLAMLVAVNILREGGRLLWKAVEGLMDSAFDAPLRAAVEAVLARHAQQEGVRFDHLATRMAGSGRFLDVHMHAPADWTLGHAAELRGVVERELMAAVPGLRATIQLLPTDVEAHLFDLPDDPLPLSEPAATRPA